jgi:Rod binding domain-containing protein
MSVAPLASVSAASASGAFNAAALRHADPAAQRTAVAQQFEAVLVRQLLGKTMTSMLGGAKDAVAGSIYGDMLTDTLARQLTAGPGLGLGKMIERQLAPRGERPAAPPAPAPTAPTQP